VPDVKFSADSKASAQGQLERFVHPNGDSEADCVAVLATRFVLWTLTRGKHKEHLEKWVGLLQMSYISNTKLSVSMLDSLADSNNSWIFDFLVSCEDKFTSRAVGDMVCAVLSAVAPLELAAADNANMTTVGSKPVTAFFDKALSLWRRTPKEWKFFSQYFRALAHLPTLHSNFTRMMLERHMVAKAIDLFIGDQSPHPEVGDLEVKNGKRVQIGEKFAKPDWKYWLSLVERLVLACALTAGQTGFALPEIDEKMLTSKIFLERILKEGSSRSRGVSVGNIISHLARENKDMSQKIIGFVSLGVQGLDANNNGIQMRPYFRALMALVLLEDSLSEQRLGWVLDSLLHTIEENKKWLRFTDFCLEHLIRMAKRSPRCYAWLQASPAKLSGLLVYLRSRQSYTIYSSNYQGSNWKPNTTYEDTKRDYNAQYPLPPILAFLQKVQDGHSLELTGEADGCDSDEDLVDRILRVNEKVDLHTGYRWKEATVVSATGNRVGISIESEVGIEHMAV